MQQALADAHTRLDRPAAVALGPRLIAAADLGQLPPVSWLVEGEQPEMPAAALARQLSADYLRRRPRALGYDEAPALERPLIDHLLPCELRG